ncbi:hypothetical protein U879_07885 [Defluviimonas sp. 20V17]|nr:hypothetical protein U879_07885 [Defluviimonas sp. 20V17]
MGSNLPFCTRKKVQKNVDRIVLQTVHDLMPVLPLIVGDRKTPFVLAFIVIDDRQRYAPFKLCEGKSCFFFRRVFITICNGTPGLSR